MTAAIAVSCRESPRRPFGIPTTLAPKATPINDPFGFGDGHDGPVVVTDPQEPLLCDVVERSRPDRIVVQGTNLKVGDILFIQQVQGANFAAAGDPAPSYELDDEGLWDLDKVSAVAGSELSLVFPLSHAFSSDGNTGRRAQACRLPQYTDVTISPGGALRAQAWNGMRGGVVGFFASGTVRLDGADAVSAVGGGFRGGYSLGNFDSCDTVDMITPYAAGGRKGEGLDGATTLLYGRGNVANGAGGGNDHNGGGGGGGNGGAGGMGGGQSGISCIFNMAEAGIGGAAFPAPIASRLSFGGGGGAGQQDDNNGGSGGAGGGIALVFAHEVTGFGSVSVNGVSGMPSPPSGVGNGDGAGGGGAGGTIVFLVGPSPFNGFLHAPGGDGGLALTNHAGGGGGGGGHVFTSTLTPTINVSGGSAAQLWGESSGTAGVIEFGAPPPLFP